MKKRGHHFGAKATGWAAAAEAKGGSEEHSLKKIGKDNGKFLGVRTGLLPVSVCVQADIQNQF